MPDVKPQRKPVRHLHQRADLHELKLFILTACLAVAGVAGWPAADWGQEARGPSAKELDRELRKLLAKPMPRNEAGGTIARIYGSAAVPEIEKLVDGGKTVEDAYVAEAALLAIALLADDDQAFKVMDRRSDRSDAKFFVAVTFMPPDPREELLWRMLTRRFGVRDSSARGGASTLILALAETGGRERLAALAAKAKTSSDEGLIRLIEFSLSYRSQADAMLAMSEAEIIACNALLIRQWKATQGFQARRGAVGAAVRALARGPKMLPAEYCVARSSLKPAEAPAMKEDYSWAMMADYSWFSREVAKGLALGDPAAVATLADDPKRPDALRRAAVALLVGAAVPAEPTAPKHAEMAAQALSAVEKLSREASGVVQTWVAEEVLAQDATREEFKILLGDLAVSEKLSAELRKKCGDYARGAK